MKNLIRCLVTFVAVIVSAELFAVSVVSLDTYDQLGNHIGEDGVFFVRDAGNTTTGQNGDPRVRKGYACYIWDTRDNGWKMINKQELLGIGDIDFSKILTIDLYTRDQDDMRRKMAAYENHYNDATNTIATLVATLSTLTNSLDTATVSYLMSENARLRSALVNITNSIIHVDSSFGELKTAVSNICASASFALGGPNEFRYKDDNPEPEPAPDPDPEPAPDPEPTPEP